ncbi:MAG TPA: prepilin-type N-terminal cleavage/methylation domain-containing protein [Longimicrobiales bacterium]|nr:prepilin-type N-terminal cleavage/methylation domain-containing protein [Longimicrobiales bacterium]
MITDRRGFTLVELIVVTVLGALLVMASLEILITNQRTYTAQTAQIQGQQATRAGVDVLFNELREISAQGGDLLAMGSTSLSVRSMRKFGVACLVTNTSPPVIRALKVGDWFAMEDSVFVFADNKTTLSSDDRWIAARLQGAAVDTTVTCGSAKAQNLTFAGQAALFTADSVRTGAAIRSFTRYRYGLITYAGDPYLGRTDAGGNTVPMVGPLKASNGVSFVYMDSVGTVTTTANKVRQIQVTIRTASGVVNSVGNTVSDSITALIYTRN